MEDKSNEAKMKALSGLKQKMSSLGGDSLSKALSGKGMMKATVMAKDSEGLEEGLKKAAEMMEEREESDDKYEGMSKEELIEMLKNK